MFGMRISINLIFSICFFIASTGVKAQWTEENTGIPFTLFSVSAVNNNVVWAAASGANMLRTTDGGLSWGEHGFIR